MFAENLVASFSLVWATLVVALSDSVAHYAHLPAKLEAESFDPMKQASPEFQNVYGETEGFEVV
jgi:hypothetical protein